MKEELINYKSAGTDCKGFLAYDPSIASKRPGILIAHAWRGQDEFVRQKARQIAELGYVGFAADVYGHGTTAQTDDRAKALMLPLFIERKLLRERIVGAYETLKGLNPVDASAIGAIGFCFGGLTVIELLRSGVDLKGVVSFHGLLGDTLEDVKAKTIPSSPSIQGSILLLTGYDDPMVSPQDRDKISKELTDAHVDWQMHIYGHTSHAFTNPEANDPAGALKYNATADHRSWTAMVNFFQECFEERYT